DDLVPHRLRLALVLHLLAVHRALALDQAGRYIALVHSHRRHRRNVHRQVTTELDEGIVPRDEVRLAVHLDHHGDLVVRVQVRADHALARLALRTLRRLRRTTRTQHVDGRLHVAVRLFQRLLALHHPGAGTLAKLLHHSSRNRGHCSVRLRVFETRSAVVSGPGPGPAVRARNVSSLQEKRCRAAGRAALQRSDALSDPGVSGLPALRFALFRRFLTRTQRGDHFRTRATLAT